MKESQAAQSPGDLIRERREALGLSQAQLALRAGSTQASISRLERGELSPTVATLARLLESMGEQLEISARRPPVDWNPAHLEDLLRLSPAERLTRAIGWNRLSGEVAEAGERARGEHA